MNTNSLMQFDASAGAGLLDGLTNSKGEFDPTKVLTDGPTPTATEVMDMAMDNTAVHFDLIGAAVELLKAQGVKQEKINLMLADGLISASVGRSAFAQRQALNTFWTLQMAKFGTDAMRYRSRLINHGTGHDWLRFFNDGPTAFIAEFDLPI